MSFGTSQPSSVFGPADVPVPTNCAVGSAELTGNGQPVVLRLANGISLTAGQVLLATNLFANELYPRPNTMPGRGQVLVTEPLPEVYLCGTHA